MTEFQIVVARRPPSGIMKLGPDRRDMPGWAVAVGYSARPAIIKNAARPS